MFPPDDLTDRLRAELDGPGRLDGPVPRVLRELGWTPPPRPRTRLPEAGDLLDLLAGGCSVHEAAARLRTPVAVLCDELVALRRDHACTSTAEVVRRTRAGH
ncbi:hypothetical protein AB2L28_02460 [Kineococcus sp. TBRC 1896]|uniref:Uncharacterized protein n=1 Tax=Kineococcus mangrovi TaxID=1660183 RepID=A0ABV4I060_9ACTN